MQTGNRTKKETLFLVFNQVLSLQSRFKAIYKIHSRTKECHFVLGSSILAWTRVLSLMSCFFFLCFFSAWRCATIWNFVTCFNGQQNATQVGPASSKYAYGNWNCSKWNQNHMYLNPCCVFSACSIRNSPIYIEGFHLVLFRPIRIKRDLPVGQAFLGPDLTNFSKLNPSACNPGKVQPKTPHFTLFLHGVIPQLDVWESRLRIGNAAGQRLSCARLVHWKGQKLQPSRPDGGSASESQGSGTGSYCVSRLLSGQDLQGETAAAGGDPGVGEPPPD